LVANAETALLNGIAAGEAYLNVHSSVFPGGEIRGYLQPTPEPATFLMAGAALAALAWRRRRRSFPRSTL
jgi:MYXO-CTERM domain-containing protein